MAVAEFRFYEELNDFLPPERRRVAFRHEFHHRGSIKDMIESLGIPHTEVELILVNGRSVAWDHIVRDGDRVAVYPVFEALDVSPLIRLRREPLRKTRFVLDGHLGTLARYLRLCGFDTAYRNHDDDETLARISCEDHRILLTRDRDLLKRRIVTHGYWVRSDLPGEQLFEVLRRFDLRRQVRPFSRCARCNGTVRVVSKAEIEDQLEPLTREHYEEFRRCERCGQIYWRGSHYDKIRTLIDEAVSRNA
ncbi:MAG: Mut7-C RNAse domain-containing protein [Xanthomonadales bacterium]|nr:Mut7-C RNAse domain-containing protein [Xanthomonadales bacterium]